jgi:general secretion pathway protein F
MPAFRYIAVDGGGTIHRGTMEGTSEAGVIEALQRQGYIPMRATRAGRRGRLADIVTADLGRRRGLRRNEIVNMTRELATLLGAGQNLDLALRFVIETAPNARVRAVMERLRDKVRGGSALAPALAAEKRNFSRLYISLVQAGEAGGKLGETLERLAGLLERQRSLTAAIQSAMIYPILLTIMAVGSIAFLLTTVLPQFVPLFAENGAELPRATRILIGLGNFTAQYGLWVLLAILTITLGARRALQDQRVKRKADALLLHIPVIGELLRQVFAARFCRTLGTLLINGVPLIAALGVARDTLGNLAALDAVEWTITRARNGAGVAQPLAERRIFPLRMIHLLRLGEETGQLGPLALKAAEIHEEQTRIVIQRLVSLLVPAITIAMGAAVAFIIGSLLTAMLSLNDLAG